MVREKEKKIKGVLMLGKEMTEDLKELESVGSAIDTKLGMIYPMYVDGTHDEEMGVHLEDIDDEWFHSLSSEDNIIVNDVMSELGII